MVAHTSSSQDNLNARLLIGAFWRPLAHRRILATGAKYRTVSPTPTLLEATLKELLPGAQCGANVDLSQLVVQRKVEATSNLAKAEPAADARQRDPKTTDAGFHSDPGSAAGPK